MYKISIVKRAFKELMALPKHANKRIAVAIDGLAENPRPAGCKKLQGDSEYMWRIRVGDYRVLYTIDDEVRIVEVRKIGDRKQVYD